MSFLELVDVHTHFPVREGTFGGASDVIRAVNGVSLRVNKGEILGLVGESGCGKSTLSRTIMQLQPANSGQISLDGEDLSSLSRQEIRTRRLDFQMVFQDPYASLNPRMTVYSTLSEALCQRPLLNLRSEKGTPQVRPMRRRLTTIAMRKSPRRQQTQI